MAIAHPGDLSLSDWVLFFVVWILGPLVLLGVGLTYGVRLLYRWAERTFSQKAGDESSNELRANADAEE